jgi:N-acetylmuramoyl-L-alanine amidase
MEESVTSNSPLVGDYFMLKCTDNPSVIVECGFLSNADDEQLLISADYQKAIAYAIFKGAVAFYG